ncbi:anti-sigma factor [Simplicispira suum]|uniref:RNA polymerase subunit sigma-70 n=1 Tax=Simplicispira suum TaxID=2109915 RepID=A0A2S0N135_9BURK|nr:anti-sigma factor [Simplicispira suum]AVO41836.1 RNA polymerase subunit sigma-70 [Simplicispira suum]
MNLNQHPELLQKLAASYALGTLRGGARRRFETLAREHPAVRAAALLWQSHWAGLTELQAPEQPPAAVWTRIANLVQAERAALQHQSHQRARQAQAAPWWQRIGLWQGAAALGAFATAAAVVVALQATGGLRDSSQQIASLQAELAERAAPQSTYVAVLRDEKAAAALLVTFDARDQQLQLQRVGGFEVPGDRSLQLWALPAAGKPRSLGVLADGRSQALPATPGEVQGVPMLAISLEPKGGVPSEGGPTGPVLFTGEWIQKSA